ncbi:polysaccharide lyase [Salinivibrio kushneri]|uniref:polysaccharide lyase n=1 Tax=Salinivibrio kushneri TaxID=1908198 RepID=UPI0022B2F7B8|nr:hypothetical protein [Salinivibrio kushneri]WBA10849.1 hypothetical protein O4546_08410 [Salinivibrio kushneri]
MKEFFRLLQVCSFSFFLLACNGSSDSSSEDTPSGPGSSNPVTSAIVGMAIDGYLEGATVFLDYNFNHTLDDNEPSVVTEAQGRFSVDQAALEACWQFVPVVVNVPVGAFDSDYGEVTRAYQLVATPQVIREQRLGEQQANDLVVSPFTTLIWQQAIATWQRTQGTELDCDSMRTDSDTREQLVSLLDEAESDIRDTYSLSTEQLYNDFIERGDSRTHNIAQQFAIGLQQAYAEKAQLEQQYPELSEVTRLYLPTVTQGDGQIGGKWLRHDFGVAENKEMHRVSEVSGTFDAVTKSVSIYQRGVELVGEVRRRLAIQSNGGSTCTVSVEYGANWQASHYRIKGRATTDFDEAQGRCLLPTSDASTLTTLEVDVEADASSNRSYVSEHTFSPGENVIVDEVWQRMHGSDAPIVVDLSRLDFIEPALSFPEGYGADTWTRSRRDIVSDSEQLELKRFDSGLWVESRVRDDEVTALRCGPEFDLVAAESLAECYQRFGVPAFKETFDGSLSEFAMDLLDKELVERTHTRGANNSTGIQVHYEGYERGSRRVLDKQDLPPASGYTLSFNVEFCEDFQFVRGGKLHGLGPLRAITGGREMTDEGWSVRLSFGATGTLSTYIYHQDIPGTYGDSWRVPNFTFTPGQYYHLQLVVQVNQPASASNGVVEVWIDDEQRMVVDNLRLRASDGTDSYIQHLLFSTFHGGSDETWAPKDEAGNFTTECAYFDDFMISH